MAQLTKKRKVIQEKVQSGKFYALADAIKLLKEITATKFVESVDVAVNLGIDARKSEQNVRGSVVLPNGTGRQVRVAVFAQGDAQSTAREAGAEVVGFEDLAERIKAGEMEFDVVIATPDSMRIVGQLGQILGPRGLMPNPKVGTVTQDVGLAVRNAKAGQVRYRNDKNGIIHCSIGKIDFEPKSLQQNLETLLVELRKMKPASAKGAFIKKLTLSSTMGPGLVIDLATVNE